MIFLYLLFFPNRFFFEWRSKHYSRINTPHFHMVKKTKLCVWGADILDKILKMIYLKITKKLLLQSKYGVWTWTNRKILIFFIKIALKNIPSKQHFSFSVNSPFKFQKWRFILSESNKIQYFCTWKDVLEKNYYILNQ